VRIKHLQQALREAGRIRMGYSTLNANGNKIPHRSDTFILSSGDRAILEGAATVYGGEVADWPEGGPDRFRLTTAVDSIDAFLPVGMEAVFQRYEQYKGGFLALTCDGERYAAPNVRGRLADQGPCMCDPDDRACSMMTAISVIPRELPGISTWRAVTHGYYSALGITAAAGVIEQTMAAGMTVPVRLFITQQTRRALVDGKPTTKHFPVLALDLAMSVAALGSGRGGTGGALSPSVAGQLPEPAVSSAPPALPSGWAPVDDGALTPAPLVTVADQLAEVERPRKPRANAAPPVPATGRRPRTAAEATAATPNCSVCGQPYGTANVVKNPEPGGSRFIHAACATDDQPPEGDPQADQPPPAGEPARDGGGVAGEEKASVRADPIPVTGTGHVRMMTPLQHRKAMALSAQAWPAGDLSGRDADDMRRERLLWLCAVLGQPELTSRTQITAATAPVLLDALEELAAGTLELTDAGLVDPATGEITVAAP
jgi:hypothetical protein